MVDGSRNPKGGVIFQAYDGSSLFFLPCVVSGRNSRKQSIMKSSDFLTYAVQNRDLCNSVRGDGGCCGRSMFAGFLEIGIDRLEISVEHKEGYEFFTLLIAEPVYKPVGVFDDFTCFSLVG